MAPQSIRASSVTVMAITPVRSMNLVTPSAHKAGAMRIADTAGSSQARSGAVSGRVGNSHLPGDVSRVNAPSTRPTTPGTPRSRTATRTPTTRTTASGPRPSADSLPTLEDVVVAYLDCRRHKRTSASATAFEIQLERNLCELHEDLLSGAYRPGRSVCFVITRPKPREVWAARFRDRIVHHLLYNRVAPKIEAGFVVDSCACIPGRGTLYAAQRLERHARSVTQSWTKPAFFLQCDLSNFFVSIDKDVLRRQLAKRIADNWWQALAELILMHDPRTDVDVRSDAARLRLVPPHKSLFNAPAHCGLPIGNLSSQFFANVYLNDLDQHIKHQMRCRYVRYVDDFVLLHESAAFLRTALANIEAFLPSRLGAQLNPTKTRLQPISHGIDFVGQVVRPWRTNIRPRTINLASSRIEALPCKEVFTTGNSYLGLLRQPSHSRAELARLANLLRRRGHCVAGDFSKIYRSSHA